eukprot:CAMPEP_0172643048 /NCGR_PEP_ID=MMETSP1068-20121228/235028_1 /TAXON_ID=35684 /ORGANISM="Pseudopedinella elastica, Strain CCMP716" /LENGTH=183 /DNA_ID=CAMNT_0013456997 /DNA_START=16 /DNA_END=567 /DNA_ORIENTATION=-
MASFASNPASRSAPNILVTGTPGTGKSATASLLAERTGLRHIEVSEVVKVEAFHEGWDAEHSSYTIDEDRLLDWLEEQLEGGGVVVDFHGCDLFPERWFDLVLVLRANNTLLFDRLTARGYSESKVRENVECEIMQVILDEARESYAEEIVHEVPSETLEHLECNADRVIQWIEAWKVNNGAN